MHILIIDDHELFRHGLKASLQEFDKEITISEAGSIAGARDVIEKNPMGIDLVLLDQELPDGKGIDLLELVRHGHPLMPVAMLSGVEDSMLMKQSLVLGAQGYIPKITCTNVVIAAIRFMLSGGTYIPPHLLASLSLPVAPTIAPPENAKDLTAREQEVFKLVREGLSNKEISYQLNISEATTKAHVSAILKAKGTHSRKLLISSK